jgi:hypothetical protein
MTQLSESGIKSRHGAGNWAHEYRRAEHSALNGENEHFGPAPKPQYGLSLDRLRIAQIVDAATAFLFACLAPALVMAALWHTMELAPLVFVITFVIALVHAFLLGLPLFLAFWLKGWINVTTCVASGFTVGAVPDSVVTWPLQHPGLYAGASVDGVPAIIDGGITAAGWFGYVEPLLCFGLLGALAGFAFWVVLLSFRPSGKDAAAPDRSRTS